MKKLLIVILSVALLTASASVAFAKFDSSIISNAKQALMLMSYGEYKKALKKLPFSSNAPTASELSDFVSEHMPQILDSDVQSDVAVAFYNGEYWQVCIPVEEPCYDSVTTFVLTSKKGEKFNGFTSKMWYEVTDEVSAAQNVIWQDEYEEGDMYVVADDTID